MDTQNTDTGMELSANSAHEQMQIHRAAVAFHLNHSIQSGAEWQANWKCRREIQAQINALELQTSVLKQVRDQLSVTGRVLMTDKRTKCHRADEHLIAIGQAECRVLCQAIHASLPRELRDIIYKCVLRRPRSRFAPSVELTSDPKLCQEPGLMPRFHWEPHKCGGNVCAKHYLSSDYMGPQVQREFVEAWLSTIVFDLGTDWQHLAAFLDSDRWAIGCRVKNFISHLQISVLDDVKRDRVRDRKNQLEGLKALSMLPPGAELTVVVDVSRIYPFTKQNVALEFEEHLHHMWDYISCLLPSRLNLLIWVNYYIKSFVLSDCGMSPSLWVDKLKQASSSRTGPYYPSWLTFTKHEKFQEIGAPAPSRTGRWMGGGQQIWSRRW